MTTTLDIGAGFCPAGFSPAGWGTPATTTTVPFVVFRDSSSGLSLTCRQIDPETGQYVFDSDGTILGMTTAQQQMLLAILTVKGTSAYKALGQSFTTIQDATPNLQRRIESLVLDATSAAVAMKIVRIVSVVLAPTGIAGQYVTINFVDLTTGKEQSVSA